jgi:hypothetical protein
VLKLDTQHWCVRACIFRTTRASGTAAPEESTTVPLIEADDCASRLRGNKADARKREMREKYTAVFVTSARLASRTPTTTNKDVYDLTAGTPQVAPHLNTNTRSRVPLLEPERLLSLWIFQPAQHRTTSRLIVSPLTADHRRWQIEVVTAKVLRHGRMIMTRGKNCQVLVTGFFYRNSA